MKTEIKYLSDYIDSLQSRGQYFFLRKSVLAVFKDKKKAAIDVAFYRLSKTGRIARVRHDFYVIVPLEYQSIGCLPASWFIDPLMQYLKVPYYVALLSAAGMYGASHQQVMTFQVMTNKMMRPIQIKNVRIDFYYQKHIHTSFLNSVKTETGKMQVSDLEMTTCDLIKYFHASGQIHNVATVLSELKENLSIEKLTRYFQISRVGVVYAERLGYLLDYLELELDTAPLHQWLQTQKCEYRPLVMGSTTDVFEKNKRWAILVNEHVETDL